MTDNKPFSEFEPLHAFALRNFGVFHILQRNFFVDFNFDENLTDKENLASLDYAHASNDADLERNAEKLSDLCVVLDSYLKRIGRHLIRLERYINAAASAVADGEIANLEEIRSRYKRGLQLKDKYATIYIAILLLRDKTEKAYKKLDEEIKRWYRKTFADRLKFARQKTGLSQRKFAPKLGMSQNGYALYELGQRDPSIPTLIRLSKILNCSTDWLLGQTPF